MIDTRTDIGEDEDMAKKTEQIGVKLSAKKKQRAQSVANALELSLSEYAEMLITQDLKAKERMFRVMEPAFGGTSNKGNGE